MDQVILPMGLTAVALVVARFGFMTISTTRQLVNQREIDRLSLELMQRRIDSVSSQRTLNNVSWNGYRKFVVDRRVEEADGVCSFYLTPHDGKPLPPFRPGQYLTFRLAIPGREKPIIRCYSHSAGPRTDYYRITVKRVMSPSDSPAVPPGLVSNYFHEQVFAGDILDVQASRGGFFLDEESERPAVLIAGGVGITPMLSMIHSTIDSESGRELILFYGVRCGADHALRDELQKIAEQHANIRLVVCYSQPTRDDEKQEGDIYHHSGHITAELLRSYLQSTNYEFYVCGPAGMMQSITGQLKQWGAAQKDIKTEAFGPAAVMSTKTAPAQSQARLSIAKTSAKPEAPKAAPSCHITFSRSDAKLGWTSEAGSILDFAESHRIPVESGCRAGNCGSCVVAIKSGQVTYLAEHGAELEDGTCLTCVAVPNGDVVLDA